MTETLYVPRGEGSIAYDDRGHGPAVLCLPSLGDTRAEYRALVPGLLATGARVLTADLRGHGESDATFGSYTLADHESDLLAVLDHAGVERAVIVGCSLSAGTAIVAAAHHPDRIRGRLLVGPAARPLPGARWLIPFVAALVGSFLGGWFWVRYYRSLFKRSPPADLDAHLAALRARYADRRYRRALAATLRAIPANAGIERTWARSCAPAAVVMGSRDPDQRDPAAEAQALADGLGGPAEVHLLDGVGHYPHLEDPAAVLAAYARLHA